MGNCFRQELRLQNLRLQHFPAQDFCVSQWKWPQWIFVGYRVSAALYTSGWSITALIGLLSEGQTRALAYLTQWTFILTSVYHVWAAVSAFGKITTSTCKKNMPDSEDTCLTSNQSDDKSETVDSKCIPKQKILSKERLLKHEQETELRQENHSHPQRPLVEKADNEETSGEVRECNSTTVLMDETPHPPTLPWIYKIQWILLTVVSVSNIVITIVYFAFLYPWLMTFNYKPSAFDINFHAVFSFISLVDLFVIKVPVRMLHCVYVVGYGVIYFIFSVVFWACDNEENILYPSILDWNQPGVSVLSTIGIIFVLMPLIQLIFYALYRLRTFLASKT